MIDSLYKIDSEFSTTLSAQWAVRHFVAVEQKSVLFAGIKISIRSWDKLIHIFNEEWFSFDVQERKCSEYQKCLLSFLQKSITLSLLFLKYFA